MAARDGGEPVRLTLRGGSQVDVRPVRPSDKRLLREAFERLSADSRYRRFLAPTPRLSEATVRYLTEVDHHDHEALAAIDPVSGRGIAVARFVRAGSGPRAEAAVTVVDDWQGRGLGTLLLELLAERARHEGISAFTALVLADNREMLELLESLGPLRTLDREPGTVEVEAALPPSGIGPHLRSMLRASAALTGAERTSQPEGTKR